VVWRARRRKRSASKSSRNETAEPITSDLHQRFKFIAFWEARESNSELAALEAENRNLKRLMLVKFREENDRLNSMLRRFGGA
jgi:hypothetical protein